MEGEQGPHGPGKNPASSRQAEASGVTGTVLPPPAGDMSREQKGTQSKCLVVLVSLRGDKRLHPEPLVHWGEGVAPNRRRARVLGK